MRLADEVRAAECHHAPGLVLTPTYAGVPQESAEYPPITTVDKFLVKDVCERVSLLSPPQVLRSPLGLLARASLLIYFWSVNLNRLGRCLTLLNQLLNQAFLRLQATHLGQRASRTFCRPRRLHRRSRRI